jgi:hypothetical protein
MKSIMTSTSSRSGRLLGVDNLVSCEPDSPGVIDLVFHDTRRIVDYKTDLDAGDQSASYVHQLKTYAPALASVGIEKTASRIHPVRIKP